MTENERKAIDTLKDMIAEGQYNGADIVARDDEEELKTIDISQKLPTM